jgi:outer membrane murein-binding lipoprotein Lpp
MADTAADPSAGDSSGYHTSADYQTEGQPSTVVVPHDSSQTVLALHEDRLRRTDLAILAYQQSVTVAAGEVRRSRLNMRIAWSLTGAMAAGLFVAVVWLTHNLSEARGNVRALSERVQGLDATVQDRSRAADELRLEAHAARLAAARAEGELVATHQLLDRQAKRDAMLQEALNKVASATPSTPATQPAATAHTAPLLDRLAQVLGAAGE